MVFFILSCEKSTVVFFTSLCSIFLLGLTDAGDQERVVPLNLLEAPSPTVLQSLSHSGAPVAVSVSTEDLNEVASSVITAENWLRTHVLIHFPGIQITTIVAGTHVLCSNDHENKGNLVLPSLKNIYHSLTRWGLEKEIKVSAALSIECLQHPLFSNRFRDDLTETVIQPLLDFLQSSNSTYSVNTPPEDSSNSLVYALANSIKNLGFSRLSSEVVTVISGQTALPPSSPFSLAPNWSPVYYPGPANPPDSLNCPPCSSSPALAPKAWRRSGEVKGMWCVAKPSVSSTALQEAMDYACGAGGADCEEIRPHGSCYYPNTVVAHASYAFNSYWQKNKKIGATCSFGGTAMIISSDPSFPRCRFMLG